MKKFKPLPRRIPRFSTYEEEANFWDTHDTSRLMREGKPVHVEFNLPYRRLVSIRLSHTLLQGIRLEATKRHIPYQTLMQFWLAEKLAEARQESLHLKKKH